MPRCAFLTMPNPDGYVIDDALAYAPLRALGWDVEAVPWRGTVVDWTAFDVVVIRSPWDYHHDPDAFLAVLGEIARAGVRLENDLDLVRWNLQKTYLRDLADRGVPIVPTVWRAGLAAGGLAPLFDEVGGDEVVVKPVVGAGASGAFRLDRSGVAVWAAEVEAYYAGRALMAQRFVPAVVAEGEFSLFYFNGAHSHTILKKPKPGDFRVQEEHGGLLRAVPAEPALHAAGARVLDALGTTPLYVRADFVRADADDTFWLMELELIEPSLYFRLDPASPVRFAEALDACWRGKTTASMPA